ncbi:hypothetical protein NBRC116589_34830 [Ruegeria sp. HU-ET01832]
MNSLRGIMDLYSRGKYMKIPGVRPKWSSRTGVKTPVSISGAIVEAHIEARSTWGSIAKLGGQIAQFIEVLSLALIT